MFRDFEFDVLYQGEWKEDDEWGLGEAVDAVTVKGNRGLLREESRRLPKVFDVWEYLGDLETTLF